jgi:hypothetical protein
MYKTICAALFAVTVLAAPALASPYRSADTPVVGTAPFSVTVLNANAHWRRHHRHHRWHFHRHHHHYDHYRRHHWR